MKIKAQLWSLFSFLFFFEDIARAANIKVAVIINSATAQMEGPNI
jgi:hypothetical protein